MLDKAAARIIVLATACGTAAATQPETTVRTENYPRPPYSGATYNIYERSGRVVCTKLKVCNKFDECETSYHEGRFLDAEDQATGSPFASTPAAVIPVAKLAAHACLARFGLVPGR